MHILAIPSGSDWLRQIGEVWTPPPSGRKSTEAKQKSLVVQKLLPLPELGGKTLNRDIIKFPFSAEVF
jgi:hypothetical protein